MAQTAGDILVDILQQWGVEFVFGLPGDGINGLMESLRKVRDKVRFVQVRHEEAAAFMACGYAKYTGKLGVPMHTAEVLQLAVHEKQETPEPKHQPQLGKQTRKRSSLVLAGAVVAGAAAAIAATTWGDNKSSSQ